MKSKGTILIAVAIFVLAGIYIGIYIGRVTSANTVYPNSIPENTTPIGETQPSLLDLNTATKEQLTQIPGINNKLATEIIEYRNEFGEYVDVDELLELDSMTNKLYEQIKEYVTVDDSKRQKNLP